MNTETSNKGIVGDSARCDTILMHFINQLHCITNTTSFAELIDKESVNRAVRSVTRLDKELHDMNGLADLVGLAEVIEELGGLGGIRLVASVNHVFQIEEGIMELEFLGFEVILAGFPAGEAERLVLLGGGGGGGGEGRGAKDFGEAMSEGRSVDFWEVGEKAWFGS